MKATGNGPPLIGGMVNVFAAIAGVIWIIFMKVVLDAPLLVLLAGMAWVVIFSFWAFVCYSSIGIPAPVKTFDPKKSLYNRAAWSSFLIQIAVFTSGVLLIFIGHRVILLSGDFLRIYFLSAFFLSLFSLILGIVSLFGIPNCGWRLILWKALLGILGSCGVVYFFILLVLAFDGPNS